MVGAHGELGARHDVIGGSKSVASVKICQGIFANALHVTPCLGQAT